MSLADDKSKTLLILSQVYIPDPASVGQHISDVAQEMARRGHRVVVYTSRRGYDDPTAKYPPREIIGGVEVRRLPFSSFGKKSLLTRGFGTVLFMIQAFIAALFTPNLHGIFFSTSPPLVGLIGCLIGILRRVPTVYWAMDLNPDQLIALGKLDPASSMAQLLESINRFILRNAALVIALDRFMAERLRQRADLDSKLVILPPWPHEQQMTAHAAPAAPAAGDPSAANTNPFRIRHALNGKFVVMYSGNHSPSNPLNTLLNATLAFRDDPDIRFLFVGGGTAKKDVDAFIARHQAPNVVSLPYQPLAELSDSLSAADLHVVSLGDAMVGIIHPCKVYGAMTVARPILFFGPRPSHISDLLDRHHIGWQISHGDTAAAVEAIRTARSTPRPVLLAMGLDAQMLLTRSLGQSKLCPALCDALEDALRCSSPRITTSVPMES